jgi:hypothetical protein
MTLYELHESCQQKLPGVTLDAVVFECHVHRSFDLYQTKAGASASWETFLANLHSVDFFLAAACLERDKGAWQKLPIAQVGAHTLLDSLRARAARLYPRDQERRETAVAEFWGHLLVAETEGTPATLARYDGQRPLAPWLIRVFANWHISQLRKRLPAEPLPDDDLAAAHADDGGGIETLNTESQFDAIQAFARPEDTYLYADAWMLQRKQAIEEFVHSVLGRRQKQRAAWPVIADKIWQGETRAHYENRIMQEIRKAVHASLNRREFFSVAAALFGTFTLEMGGVASPQSVMSKEEMQALLAYTSRLRLHNGDIVTCRRILDLAVDNQIRCWQQGPQRAADADTLMDLLDHHFAVTLDSYEIPLVQRDLAVMNSLLPLMGARRPSAERRYQQSEARLYFHTDDVHPAVGVARRMVKTENPDRFLSQTLRDVPHSDDFNAIIQVFEVGTFLSGVGIEDCYRWWDVAHRQTTSTGDSGNAARVEARMLARQAEDNRHDRGRARANAERLQMLPVEVPEIQNHPLWRIQHQLAMLRCLLIGGKDPEALALLEQLAAEILRVGYRQGAARLERASRLAVGSLQEVVLSRTNALLRACRLSH